MDLSSALYIPPIRSTLTHIRSKSRKNLGFYVLHQKANSLKKSYERYLEFNQVSLQ